MVTEQETLIYIEDQDKHNASVAANAFAHKDVKNRAYINTLGAELALKYLASENIDISNIHNIHSIKKILEEIDISDIMLSNIHIDVRVVFDENAIFIPKSHFEYNLVPDIYLVLNLAKDFSHVKFLGFFEPKLINKNNANEQYYFIEKEKLSPVKDLKHYIETFNGNTYENLDEKDLTKCERIIISMADNDISEIDKRYLIKQLTKSAELRDKFLEYENFETLSYKAMTDPQVKRKEPEENISVDDALSQLENFTETNTQEALDTLVSNKTDDIETPAETGSDDLLNEISEAVIDGTAAIAGTAAAETLTDITDDTSHIIDTAIAGINLAEAGFDTENKPEDNEKILDSASAISFDNVDTSELDNITAESENIDEQPISLNDVEVPQETVQTDFIDTIDNKISFDDIPSPETLETPLPLNLDEEKISLDNIDTADINTENQPKTYEEETISLDNIDTSDITEDTASTSTPDEAVVSFDDIALNNLETDIPLENDNSVADSISSEDMNEPDIASADTTDDFMDDSLTLDDTALQISNENAETNEIGIVTEPLDETDDFDGLTSIEDINDLDFNENKNNNPSDTGSEEPEIVEDAVQSTEKNKDGFGKSLLDNLSEENLDDISIEDLGLNDENLPAHAEAENISSDDLLSQVDDILSSSPDTGSVSNTAPNINTDTDTNVSLDEIPDISDIAADTNIAETSETQTVESFNENNENGLTSDDSDSMTAIDDLLNTDFSNDNEEDNPEENDSIGVLFNDTDPVTDAELDNMEEFNPEQPEVQPQQTIPGAALYNKKTKNNKSIILVAGALIAVIAAASAVMVFKQKNSSSADIEVPSAQTAETEIAENPLSSPDSETTQGNILATNAPDINDTNKKQTVQTKQPAKELKNTALKPKQSSAQGYLDVSKLVWDVPDTLSYSPKIQNYLRTAGKSIKLSLSADLLLAKEYAYTNQVKVGLKVSKDGAVQDIQMLSGSGSSEIDKIVLQSVKDTLNVVKPPSSEIKTPDFNLSLTIYF